MVTAAPKLEVRAVGAESFDDIYPLLLSFGNRKMSRDDWRRMLFDYTWWDGPARGFALYAGGAAVGFLGTIFSKRRIGGRDEVLCNASCWIVREEFRSASILLLKPLLAMRDCTLVNLTTTPRSYEIFKKLGFVPLEREQLLLAPLANPASLLGSSFTTLPQDFLEHLALDERAIYRALRDDPHVVHLLLRRAGRQCYLVATRRHTARGNRRPLLGIDGSEDMIEARLIKDRVNGIARRSLAPVPLPLWEKAFPKDVIALCYHMVSDEDLGHFALYPYKTSAQFEADVTFARDRAVTYRAVADNRLCGAPLPPNSLLFTFDDGMAQCYSVIRPILQRHGVDGVFFVTTNYLDDRQSFSECTISRCLTAAAELPLARVEAILATVASNGAARSTGRERVAARRLESMRRTSDDPARRRLFLWLLALEDEDRAEIATASALLGLDGAVRDPYFMSRDEVRRLAADGFTIGSHGLTHRSLEGSDGSEIEAEIVASCEAVRELTGQERVPFAFPYSGLSVDRSVIGDIVRRNPLVELVFDSGCLRRDPNFIVNRVFADTPPQAASTNLPATLRDAWSIPSAWFRVSS